MREMTRRQIEQHCLTLRDALGNLFPSIDDPSREYYWELLDELGKTATLALTARSEGFREAAIDSKMGDLLVKSTWLKCVGQCVGDNCGRLFVSRERFDEHIAPLIRALSPRETDADHLADCKRALQLAQTEIAGHIRIEDELKSDLAQAQARVETMLAAAKYWQDQADEAQARCAELEKALTRIEEWSSFPPAESNGEPCSYGVAYGSNGERDYMRGIAKVALKARPKPSSR